MIAVLQRASAGRVTVRDRVIGEIGTGWSSCWASPKVIRKPMPIF